MLNLQEVTEEASAMCPSGVSDVVCNLAGLGASLFFVSGIAGTSILQSAISPLLAPLFGSSVGLIGIGNNYLSAL